jgi:hypothetical protein
VQRHVGIGQRLERPLVALLQVRDADDRKVLPQMLDRRRDVLRLRTARVRRPLLSMADRTDDDVWRLARRDIESRPLHIEWSCDADLLPEALQNRLVRRDHVMPARRPTVLRRRPELRLGSFFVFALRPKSRTRAQANDVRHILVQLRPRRIQIELLGDLFRDRPLVKVIAQAVHPFDYERLQAASSSAGKHSSLLPGVQFVTSTPRSASKGAKALNARIQPA